MMRPATILIRLGLNAPNALVELEPIVVFSATITPSNPIYTSVPSLVRLVIVPPTVIPALASHVGAEPAGLAVQKSLLACPT